MDKRYTQRDSKFDFSAAFKPAERTIFESHWTCKRAFLLFEILIALSLMAMILSLLFSFMIQSLKIEKKMEKARIAIFERQTLQVRLQNLLTSLNTNEGQSPLYTQIFPKEEENSLVAFFDHGIDPDPAFSGTLLARLYIDEKKDLCLVFWPIGPMKNRPWRKEVLLSNVSDFSLQFLGKGKEGKILWSADFPKTNDHFPTTVRISLKQEGIPLQFAFHLPVKNLIPTYKENPP